MQLAFGRDDSGRDEVVAERRFGSVLALANLVRRESEAAAEQGVGIHWHRVTAEHRGTERSLVGEDGDAEAGWTCRSGL